MPDAEATPFETLLALQDEDVRASQLQHQLAHLPEAAELGELEGRIARLDAGVAGTAARREELTARRDGLEQEIEEIGGRIGTIERRAASGSASSYRDQEAMAGEVESLRRRRTRLEDEELETMEQLEPLEAELALAEEQRRTLAGEAMAARARLTEATSAVQEALAEVAARRQPLAAALPAAMGAEYDRLAARLGGVAVARVAHGMCEGCRLQLPATEVDRIRHAPAGTLFHCDQCGRILVPSAAPGGPRTG